MAATPKEGQDALSLPRPSTSLCPAPNLEVIISGSDLQARTEIANTLTNLVATVNAYISRKGL